MLFGRKKGMPEVIKGLEEEKNPAHHGN